MSVRAPRVQRQFPPDSGFIRLSIEGSWTAYDMAALLGDLSRLYDIRRSLDMPPIERREAFGRWFGDWWGLVDLQPPSPMLPGTPLLVVRVRYESPGFTDLAGLGKIVEQLRIFIQDQINLWTTRDRRRLEAEGMEQDVIAKRIENAQRFLDLAERTQRDFGLSPHETRRLLLEVDERQGRLLEAIADGRVTGVRELPGPEPPRGRPPAAG